MKYTIQKTALVEHRKLTKADSFVSDLEKTLQKITDTEVVVTDLISYKAETAAFIATVKTALADYKTSCSVITAQEYTDKEVAQLVEEYQKIDARIKKLRRNKQIHDVEENEQFRKLLRRNTELKEIYDQLLAAGWKP